MDNAFGISLLSVLWGLTIIGVFFKIRFTGRFEIVSVIIYLLMGWIMVVGGRKFFDSLPVPVLVLICIGGGLYSIGVIFYIWDKYLSTHAVWHAFVLAARHMSLCSRAAGDVASLSIESIIQFQVDLIPILHPTGKP